MTTDDWLSVSNTHRHSDVCWFSSLLLCSRLCCVLFSSALICFFFGFMPLSFSLFCVLFSVPLLFSSAPLCSVLIRSFIVAFYPPLFPFFSCVPSCSPLFPCVPFCSLSFCSRLFLSLLCCSLLFHFLLYCSFFSPLYSPLWFCSGSFSSLSLFFLLSSVPFCFLQFSIVCSCH